MPENALGVRDNRNSSVRILGIIISSISVLQVALTLLLFTQDNLSIIFVSIQNIVLIILSLVFTVFSIRFGSTRQLSGTEENKIFIRYFLISLIVGLIIITFYITTVPFPQPKFDEEGVSFFYTVVIILSGSTFVNLLIHYLGAKSFQEWIAFQINQTSINRLKVGILLYSAAIITYLLANIPLLEVAVRIESYANPIDPSVFILHFLIAIALIFIALGILLVGGILEILTGYKLLKINKK